MNFVVFTKTGGPLTKRISLTADGKIASDGSACTMARGRARRVLIDGMDELAALIESLNSNQAIALGALRDELPDEVGIVTKRALKNVPPTTPSPEPATTSSTGRGRPALVLFDYDMKGMPRAVAQQLKATGGFWAALMSVTPCARVGRPPAAAVDQRRAEPHRHRRDFPGSGGLHGYVTITDGADAVRFLKTLHARCWLAGFGWMNVGAAGQLLERSIVDRMVGAAERLVFEGPPVVEPPLHRTRPRGGRRSSPGTCSTRSRACPPLSIVEQQAFDSCGRRRRLALAPRMRRQARRLDRQPDGDACGAHRHDGGGGAAVLEKQANGVLLGSVELPFDDDDLAGMTVGDVLDDPARFAGETLADPIEGVEDGRCKAKVMWDGDGPPFINSFAHGHAIYQLRYDAAAVQARIARADRRGRGTCQTGRHGRPQRGRDRPHWPTTRRGAPRRRARRQGAAEGGRSGAAGARVRGGTRADAGRTQRPAPDADDRPALDAEWLPVLGIIDEVAECRRARARLRRDIDGTLTRERRMPIAQTHAFNTANDEGG